MYDMVGKVNPRQSIIYLIIFFEGLVAIAVEILAIRQLIPFVGNSVIITSMVIGLFLLFLAGGYYRGGKFNCNLLMILRINLTIAALIIGVGLSTSFLIFWFFYLFQVIKINLLWALITYLLLIIAPVTYLLGQTIPITMNLFPPSVRVGEIGGKVLSISTCGSFLGAVFTTIILMNTLGVAVTILINTLLLACLTLFITHNYKKLLLQLIIVIGILLFTYLMNVQAEKKLFVSTDSYANYQIENLPASQGKLLIINFSPSSAIYSNQKGFRYIELIKTVLFNNLQYQNKSILVLGAGGFTLNSPENLHNKITYVDIDKKLKKIVVPQFQKKINGNFIAQDARIYLTQSQQHYDAIIVDTYSNLTMIPTYLLTQEFFQTIRKHLNHNGLAVFNIVANPTLSDKYSKTIDNTLRSVFSSCMSVPLRYTNGFTNILYFCQENKQTDDESIYTDNLNTSDIDYFANKD